MGIGIIKLVWAMFENYDMPDVVSTWVCCCFGLNNHDGVYVAATLTDSRVPLQSCLLRGPAAVYPGCAHGA